MALNMLEVAQDMLIKVFSMVFHQVSILLEVIIPEELQAAGKTAGRSG